MNRHYYACPIDAAFMAERHGMTFMDKDDNALVFSVSDGEIAWYMNSVPYHLDMLYLTPKSEAMLKLQDGDIVQTAARQYEEVDHSGAFQTNKNGVIVYRNGHPFIMPQQDNRKR